MWKKINLSCKSPGIQDFGPTLTVIPRIEILTDATNLPLIILGAKDGVSFSLKRRQRMLDSSEASE